jgi:hypothetical protein
MYFIPWDSACMILISGQMYNILKILEKNPTELTFYEIKYPLIFNHCQLQ